MRSESKSLVLIAACLVTLPAVAATTITLSPTAGHPAVTTQVSGTGFGANEAVDIYFDTTDEILEFTNGSGNFGPDNLRIPASALPGAHWITALGRKDGDGVHKAFTVRTNWASHGWNARGQRYNAYENVLNASNVASLDLAWSFPTGAAVFSSPAYSAGIIYFGSEDHNVYALTPAGAQKWKHATGDQVESSPAVSGNTVYVGSDDGKLYALNTSTGAVRWTATTGGAVISSPAVANGVVYVGSQDASLYAFDASTGSKLWSLPTGGAIHASSPAVADGRVFIGSTDHKLYAADAKSGAELWSFDTGSIIFGPSPAVADGFVFIASDSFDLYSLEASRGLLEWTATLGSDVLASPAVANGLVYISASAQPQLYAFSAAGCGAASCNPVWQPNITSGNNSSAAIANGVVYIGGQLGLTAADARTGNLLWFGTTGWTINSSPTIADGMVLVGSDDGSLYAYELNGGNNAVYHRDPNPPSYALLHPDYRLKPVRH